MQTYLPDTAYAEFNINSLPQVSLATVNSGMLHRALIRNYIHRQNCIRMKIYFPFHSPVLASAMGLSTVPLSRTMLEAALASLEF